MKNIANILMAAGALAMVAAAFFAPVPVRIALLSGAVAFGVGYFYNKFSR
jgi:hypothetical protein